MTIYLDGFFFHRCFQHHRLGDLEGEAPDRKAISSMKVSLGLCGKAK